GIPYPNPFNPTVHFTLQVTDPAPVSLSIVDVSGRTIFTFPAQFVSPGTSQWSWEGVNSQGEAVATGMYFLVGRQGQHRQTRKILLLK
ncbi:MAG: T9SS C-terminal target domain-containing protein, partial [Candidatus Neomarinimicrobiota bacterium]